MTDGHAQRTISLALMLCGKRGVLVTNAAEKRSTSELCSFVAGYVRCERKIRAASRSSERILQIRLAKNDELRVLRLARTARNSGKLL